MTPIALVDLDDTLLQTRGKCPPGVELWPAATGRDGQPLSFMTPAQRALFAWLDATTRVVPVTARTLDAFQRVALPFRHGAVLSFGGTVLRPDGQPDLDWHANVDADPGSQWLRAMLLELMRK